MPPQIPTQNQTNPTPTPHPDEKHLKKARLLFLIVILILVGILSAGYFVNEYRKQGAQTTQQIATSTDEFADWKTYRNEEYGFEFKYPGNLIYQDSIYASTKSTAFYTSGDYSEGIPPKFEFSSDILPENETLVTWVDYTEYTLNGDPYEQVDFNSNNFIRWFEDIDTDQRIINYSVLIGNNIITLTFTPNFSEWKQVLSTFKFISNNVLTGNIGIDGGSINNNLLKFSINQGGLLRPVKFEIEYYKCGALPKNSLADHAVDTLMKAAINIRPIIEVGATPPATEKYLQSIKLRLIDTVVPGTKLEVLMLNDIGNYSKTNNFATVDNTGTWATFETKHIGLLVLIKPEDIGKENSPDFEFKKCE